MIRLGILGAGAMGQRIAAAAVETGRFVVTSVADANLERATQLGQAHDAPGFADVDELVEGPPIDAVYVGLPHHVHETACLAAGLAGVHVLIDKPLCNTQAEADNIVAAATRSSRVWMVGFSYRFRSDWRRVHEVVSSGAIGRPYFVSDVVIEAYRHTPAWYWDPACGGGTLQLQSHHSFDRISWILGSKPQRVACRVVRLPGGADKSAQISAQYHGGAVAGMSLSFGLAYDASPRTLFVVQGESGMIQLDDARTLRVCTTDGLLVEDHSSDNWLAREMREFADAIDGTLASYPSIGDGVTALRSALAAARSADLEGWVDLDA